MRLTLIFVLAVMATNCFAQVPVNEKKSTSFMYYYFKGEEHFENRRFEEALVNYNEALNLYPYHAESYLSRAAVREKLGDRQGALQDYTLALEFKPDQYDALFSKALILFDMKKWELAARDFQRLLQMPKSETASIFFRQDRFSEGITDVFTTQGSNKGYLFNYLALTEFELEEYTTALVHFDSAIFYHPDEANYFVNRGRCFEAAGNTDRAITDYQRALELRPDHGTAKHNLSNRKRSVGDEQSAEYLLSDVIAKNPELPFPHAERGYYLLQQGKYSEAIKDYSNAIRLSPDEAEYYLNRGSAYEKSGERQKAFKDFSAALRLDDTQEKAWLARANLLYQMGRYDEAIEDYDIAIYNNSEYGTAYYNRALARYRIGRRESACEDLQTAQLLGFNVPEKVIAQICKSQKN